MAQKFAIEIKPLSGALGAEVLGADVKDPATHEQIHDALMDHGVLMIRNQDLTPAQHKAFCRSLGEPLPVPFVHTLEDHPEIIAVIKEADERTEMVFGVSGIWISASLPRCPKLPACTPANCRPLAAIPCSPP